MVRKKSSRVVVLQGQNSARIEEEMKNMAPCSLPILDKKIYPERCCSGDPVHYRECGSREKEESIVLCDQCQDGFRIWCLTPPLFDIPLGSCVRTLATVTRAP